MKRRDFIKKTGLSLSTILLYGCNPLKDRNFNYVSKNERPNIVLILADDLGFSDLGCYGSEIDTPNLDKLALNGITFNNFYNAARCCPSRASLLTGLYPHQVGLGHMNYDLGYPAYKGSLSKKALTIAEALKLGGYRTYMAGKWHVAHPCFTKEDIDNWPCQRGFDKFFGTLAGFGSQWDPPGLINNNEFIEPDKDFFYTDAISNKAVEYIRETASTKAPFFLYVAYTAPHYPLHARQKTIKKYDGIYDAGWVKIRKKRLERMKKKNIVQKDFTMQQLDPASIPWSQEPNKKWQAQRMQAYAAMVDEMDQGIGNILDTLKKENYYENTLVIFLSDNGGSCEGHLYNTIERTGDPWTSPIIPDYTSDGEKVISGDIPGIPPGPENTFGSYGLKWASVSNTPFRRHKSWVHEGGIATPCIMHWPERIKNSNFLNEDTCHIIDLLPTFLDISKINYPSKYKGKKLLPLQGVSLYPIIKGKHFVRGPLFWEHEGNRAVIYGKWKLVSEFPALWKNFYPKQDGKWELYNLETDRGELNDLSNIYPKKVEYLKNLYEEWEEKAGVIGWQLIN